MNYIILNDVNSNTIQGLLIQNLPPITKPKIRTNIEEIDGKDGDIITKLGYSAYDKEFDIGLYGSYDVNEVISYFNSEGTVIFSNEDDKFYKYSIIEQIDFERLIRFKTAKVKMHVQPFKYSNEDEDIEIYATETDAEGTNITINNTENGASFIDMQLKGQTSQHTTIGYNSLPPGVAGTHVVNGLTHTSNGEGTYTLHGTATSTSRYDWSIEPYTIKSGDYLYLGNTAINNGVTVALLSDASTQIMYTGTTQVNRIVSLNNYAGQTINFIRTYSNAQTLNNFKLQPMICDTTTRTSFEKYTNGPSPNPSYPQDVNSVTGNVGVYISNKNLIEDETFVQGSYLDNTMTTRISCRNTKLKSNTTYTLSSDLNYSNYNIAIVTSTNQFPIPNNSSVKYDSGWKSANFSFTTGDDDVYINIAIKKLPDGVTITPNDVAGKKFQIEVGSTATTYIQHQGQNYEINLGKNLFDKNSNIVTPGYLNANGEVVTTDATLSYQNKFINVKPNTTYTISSDTSTIYRIAEYNNNQTFISRMFNANASKSYSFTTSNNTYYIKMAGTLTSVLNTLQLEKGAIATSYAPYFEPIELRGIDSYQDYFHKNNGNWYIHREIEKLLLTSSMPASVTASASYGPICYLNVGANYYNNTTNIINIMSSKLVGVSYDDRTTLTNGYRIFTSDTGSIVLRFPVGSSVSSVLDVQNFLTENNIYVYAVLKTPTETQITDENLIAQLEGLRGASTYIGQTNIITSGDLTPIIYVNTDTIDVSEIEVVNSGNYYSKPVVTITGYGTINLYLNDYQVFIIELGDTETTITLDVENMEAYNINTGQLMNRQVTGDYNNFIFNAGTNIITWSGTIASVQIVNYSRWI